MAVLYVSEYQRLGLAQGQTVAAGHEPSVAEQAVVIGVGSTSSAAFSSRTNFVRLNCDSVCSVAFGASPTALTTAKRMAANQTEFFAVAPGHSVAVIANV
jgi:hypothetical protein